MKHLRMKTTRTDALRLQARSARINRGLDETSHRRTPLRGNAINRHCSLAISRTEARAVLAALWPDKYREAA